MPNSQVKVAGHTEFPGLLDFELLTNSISHCMLVHDAETKDILWANQAACTLLGFSLEELKPLKSTDMSSSERRYRRTIARGWLQKAAEVGENQTRWKYRARNGHEFLTHASAKRLKLSGRTVLLVEFRDIESQLTLKRRLTGAEELTRAVLEHSAAGVLLLNREGQIITVNPTATRILRQPVSKLLGATLASISIPQQRDHVTAIVNAHLAHLRESSIRLEVPRADGSTIWLEGILEYIRGGRGEGHHAWLFHDSTQRVESERDELRVAAHANYISRQHAMGDMAMTLVHELAQPVAAANNFLVGLTSRMDHLPVEVADGMRYGVENCQLQVRRAAAIINSVQRFAGTMELAEFEFDLNEIVRECLYFIRLRSAEKGVTLAVTLVPEVIAVKCERILIGQAIMNLCFNAIDEMACWHDRDRTVHIITEISDGCGHFTVRDDGRGLAHIPGGDVFGGAFTSKADGHGVGLALSHRIITRQGGTISASNNPLRGATFGFRLPLAGEPVDSRT